MATQDWGAAYEAAPANTDSVSGGDDQIRALKRDIRERLMQGGHFYQGVGADNLNDGKHIVDGGGAGVSPNVYKSNKTDLLVAYTDTLIRLYEDLQLDGPVTAKDRVSLEKALLFTAGAVTIPGSGATALGVDVMLADVDTSGGNATITLPDISGGASVNRILLILKRQAANAVTITNALLNVVVHNDGTTGSKTYTSGRTDAWLCVSTSSTWMVFEQNTQGVTPSTQAATNAGITVVDSDILVVLTTTAAAAFNVTLPDAANLRRWPITVKHKTGTGTCNIQTTGGDTINGAAAPLAVATATPVTLFPTSASNWETM